MIILLVVALLLVVLTAVPQEQPPTPEIQDQLGSDFKVTVEPAQEILSLEAKQDHSEIEARIYADRIASLGRKVNKIEERLDDAPPWWVPMVASAFLGAAVGFFCSRLSAHHDWLIAREDERFARATFTPFKDSLDQNLAKHATGIDLAERVIDNTMKSPFVRPIESQSDEELRTFDVRAYSDALRELELKPFELSIPREGKRHTKTIGRLFEQYRRQTEELNRCLRHFWRLARTLSYYEAPDRAVLVEHGVELANELKKSESYQASLAAAQERDFQG